MNSRSKDIEMCEGPILPNMFRFMVPIMLTSLFQQLFHAADVLVVGRYAGEQALAGVGTTGSLTALLLNLFLGMSVGVSVVLGRALGERNENDIRATVHTAMSMSIVFGAFISIIGILFAEPLLTLIAVPDDVMPQAKIYMQIVFAGKIPSLFYNFGAAVLRAKGDSRRPLFIVMVSGVVNVVLNLFFVIVIGMAAEGVALATVISQVIMAVYILFILMKETDSIKLDLRKLRFHKRQCIDIIKVGLPSGLQNITFSVSNVIIQSSVNTFSTAAIAGSTASSNIGSFYYAILNSCYISVVPFISRNIGARKFERIGKIIRSALLFVVIIWIGESILTITAKEFLIGLYAPGNDEAIKMGSIRLGIVGCTYGLCGIMEVMSGVLRGMGHSLKSMIASIAGVCGIRILWVYTVFAAVGTFESLFYGLPLSWLGTAMIHTTVFIFAWKKLKRTEKF